MKLFTTSPYISAALSFTQIGWFVCFPLPWRIWRYDPSRQAYVHGWAWWGFGRAVRGAYIRNGTFVSRPTLQISDDWAERALTGWRSPDGSFYMRGLPEIFGYFPDVGGLVAQIDRKNPELAESIKERVLL